MNLLASTLKRSSSCRQRKMGRSEEGVNPAATTRHVGIAQDEVEGVQAEGEFERVDKVNQLHRNPKGRIFSTDEERQLTRSVLSISQDPICGNQ